MPALAASRRASLAVFATILLGPGGTAQGKVWLVDVNNGPGATHTTVQSAVITASNGDTILVRSGVYGNFVVDGKSLVISGETTASVVMVGHIDIRRIGANQSVTLQGLEAPTIHGLIVDACAGPVLIQNCRLGGSGMRMGCAVSGSAAVTLVRCRVAPTGYGTQACVVANSTVHLFDCYFGGGGGGFTAAIPAFELKSGSVFAAGCRIQGRQGLAGSAYSSFCLFPPTNGADAMWVGGTATLQDCIVQAGKAGQYAWPCLGARDGVPIVIRPGGRAIRIARPARRMQASSPVREAQTATVELTGQPGDAALLLIDPRQRPLTLPAYLGTILPDLSTAVLVPVGSLPQGRLTLRVPIPDLGGGVDTQTLFLQAAIVPTNQSIVLGAPGAIVLLDRRF